MPLAIFTHRNETGGAITPGLKFISLDLGVVPKSRHWKLKSVQLSTVLDDTAVNAEFTTNLGLHLKLFPSWLSEQNQLIEGSNTELRVSSTPPSLLFVAHPHRFVDVGTDPQMTGTINVTPSINFGFVTVNNRVITLGWSVRSSGNAGIIPPIDAEDTVASMQIIFEYSDL